MPPLEKLVDLLPPPSVVPPIDWQPIVDLFGFAVPHHHVDLMARYGPGSINDALRLLVPHHPLYAFDMVRNTQNAREGMRRYAAEPDVLPDPFDPDDLVCWATTTEGSMVFWHIPSGQTLIHDRAGPWLSESSETPFFLWAMLTGRPNLLLGDLGASESLMEFESFM
jgi:hypothetical protein